MNNTYKDQYIKSSRIIYTPSIFAKENLLYLQEIGEKTDYIPHSSIHDNLESYLFLIINDGSGYITSDNDKRLVVKDDIVFLDCTSKFSLLSDDKDLWSFSWIHFNGPTMKEIYKKYIDRANEYCFKCKDINSFNVIYKRILDLAMSSEYAKDMMINEQLSSLLTLLMKNNYNQKITISYKDSYSLNNIYNYLKDNFLTFTSLDDLANKFNINKYYLTRIFKSTYNISIVSYILNLKINHSKELLRFSNDSIEEVALKSGFNDSNYYTRTFKKLEMITPLAYRKQWKNK